MKIAVYSGSFDPLHIGHLAIMEYLTGRGGFDMVYLVVSPQNPFKDPSNVMTAEARYEAAVEAVKRHPGLHVHVEDIELGMEPPHYTIRTMDALCEREPENEFVLVIGADNLDVIRQWKDADRLLKEYGVVAFPRRGYDLEAIRDGLNDEGYDRIMIADAPMVDISSTEIREGMAAGMDMDAYLM